MATPSGPEDRRSLLETVRLEGARLDRYIQNLLDMTRLGHGGLTLNRDWIGVDELIGSAVARLQRYQPDTRFDLRFAPGLAPMWVHPALVEQALFNVIENAAKFSPAARRSWSTRAMWTGNCASKSQTVVPVSRKTSANGSSTCSTASNAAIGAGRAPAWAWRSRRA
jgi:signal transduction histidine kinase